MPNLGVSELIVIFLILLVVFGASRLPELGEGLGRTIRNFKRGISDDRAPPSKSVASADKPSADKPPADKHSLDKADATDADLVDKS